MRADAAANRRAILAAAWTLYAERGTDASMRTVAQEAGVGVATLYRHFPTANDLLVGLLGEVFERIEQIVHAKLAEWDRGPEAAWSSAIREISGLGFGALLYQFAPRAQEIAGLAEEIEPMRAHMFAVFDQLAGRARKAGLLDPEFPTERIVVGISAISRPVPQPVEDVVPGQVAWLVERYISGLRPM